MNGRCAEYAAKAERAADVDGDDDDDDAEVPLADCCPCTAQRLVQPDDDDDDDVWSKRPKKAPQVVRALARSMCLWPTRCRPRSARKCQTAAWPLCRPRCGAVSARGNADPHHEQVDAELRELRIATRPSNNPHTLKLHSGLSACVA